MFIPPNTRIVKNDFSYQSEFFLMPESGEFAGEREVGFKFGNVANFVRNWWSEG